MYKDIAIKSSGTAAFEKGTAVIQSYAKKEMWVPNCASFLNQYCGFKLIYGMKIYYLCIYIMHFTIIFWCYNLKVPDNYPVTSHWKSCIQQREWKHVKAILKKIIYPVSGLTHNLISTQGTSLERGQKEFKSWRM